MIKEQIIQEIKRSLVALEEIVPPKIPYELLSEHINMGERWLKTDYFQRFAVQFFNCPMKVHYFKSTDNYKVECLGHSQIVYTQYKVPTKSRTNVYGDTLLEYALENTTPHFTYTDATGEKRVDNDAIQLANEKIEAIRQGFTLWLNELPEEEKDQIVDTYNRLYNNCVLRKYNGSYMKLPGLQLENLGISSLYDGQKNAIWRIIQSNGAIIDHEVGSGKAQPLDAKILTPTGWVLMGDIKTGDEVISVDGKSTKVIGVYPQGEKDIYRVTMNDGSFTECCEDHLWTVKTTNSKQDWMTLDIKQLLDENLKIKRTGKDNDQVYSISTFYKKKLYGKHTENRWQIPVVKEVQFKEQKTFIHPYILGALIGDGSLNHNTANFTSADSELIENISINLPKGYQIKKINSSKYGYNIIFNKNERNGENKIVTEIKNLGLNKKSEHKFIPDIYKFNSVANRIALLRGLMDTDGCCEINIKGTSTTPTFCTVSKQLCDDVVFLVQSLGGIARVRIKTPHYKHKGEYRTGQLAYTINISLPADINPFALDRKASIHIPRSKYFPARFISNIELVDRKQAQCIKVDHPTQLYVTDDFIVTHNTMVMICASYEMKRMKLKRKPAILALKANIGQIVETYQKTYPGAKLLAPTEKDFEKENRLKLFYAIKNNDWDCVIMTHDQFGKIPQSAEIQQSVINEEIQNLEDDLGALRSMGHQISRTMKKGLEKRKANLEAKLKELQYIISEKQDEGVTFEDMGIDHLFIDESHRFKNLSYVTRHDRVAGLGNTAGSQKAMNMLFAIRTLQKRFNADMQVTFLTGTPISNSLTEMYLLFKYLRPRALAKQNIHNFDSWVAVFAKKTTDFEFSVTNQIIAKERFRHFIKVPELALFYNEIADYQTNKSINIDKPEMEEELVPLKPTEDQKDFIKRLIMFAKTGEGHYIGRPPLTDSEQTARMLIATNYAKKMSADMRLIDESYEDHPFNKVSVCAKKVYEFYTKFHEQKGTQLVFSDVGTPKEAFNLYDALRNKLVDEYGIPKEEIVFIHDYNEKTRHKLFQKVNDGDIRILIGSTDKAGTGVNVQKRIVAMHHLDIPWKPAELEQRGGRGNRQGNVIAKLFQDNKVYNYIYAVEQSLDNYKFTLLKNKQTFISQMKRSELSVRSLDEGSFDESTGMNFAEYIAVLSGDTSLLEKAKIDKKLALLENLKTLHYREISNNKYLLEHKKQRIEEVAEILVSVYRDDYLYQSSLQRDEKTQVKLNLLKIKDFVYTEEASPDVDEETAIGQELTKLFHHWRPTTFVRHELIATIYGFNVFIERSHGDQLFEKEALNELVTHNKFYVQHPEGGFKYLFNGGILSIGNPKITARNPLNAIDRVASILEKYEKEYTTLLQDVEGLQRLEVTPFSKNEEIDFLKQESKRLQVTILEKMNQTMAEA